MLSQFESHKDCPATIIKKQLMKLKYNKNSSPLVNMADTITRFREVE